LGTGGTSAQDTQVIVDHPDGTAAVIEMTDRLPSNGGTSTPGTVALTEDQAVAVAGDPAFSRQMDSGFVQAAATQYSDLPPVY
jgi:hypothetical protein